MVFGIGKSSDKGKSAIRAAEQGENERSPLLGQSSTAASVRHGRGLLDDDDEDDDAVENQVANASYRRNSGDSHDSAQDLVGTPRHHGRSHAAGRRFGQHSVRAIICYILLVLLGIVFIVFAILHIWLGRFVSEQFRDNGAHIQERARDAFVYRGPDKVKILEMSESTTTVQIDMRMGVDVRTVFGWNDKVHIQEDSRPRKLPLSRRWERAIVGWASRRIGQTTLDLPEPVIISPQSDHKADMAQFSSSSPLVIPLWFPKNNYDPSDDSWLRNVTLTVPLQVLQPALLASFINQTVEEKQGEVHLLIQRANVALGKEEDRSMFAKIARHYGGQSITNIENDVAFELPDSPDTPKDPSALVDLLSYDLIAIPINNTHHNSTKPSERLGIAAKARIENPAYEKLRELSLDLDIPFAWPYTVYLPSTENKSVLIPLADGVVEPFTISSHSRHFNVSINGTVASSSNSSTSLSQSLSSFVTRFLSGKANKVYLSFDAHSPFARKLPSFLVPLLKPIQVSYDIPGLPAEERDLLKNLQFSNLKIHPSEDGNGGFQLDGILQGELLFPPGLDKLENPINITSIWPDIVLYDGLPPMKEDKNVPPKPLPANAFARFRTSDWAPAITEKTGNHTIMRSFVQNVPLDVLRGDVLRRWLAKIIFSGGRGTLTGVKGFTQARAGVRGFGEIELNRLVVLGNFLANKPPVAESLLGLLQG